MWTGWRRVGGLMAAGALIVLAPLPVARAHGPTVAIQPGEVTITNGAGSFVLVNNAATAMSVTLTGMVARDNTSWRLTFAVGTSAAVESLSTPVEGHGSVLVAVRVGAGVPADASGVLTLVTDLAGPAQFAAVTVTPGSPTALTTSASADLRYFADRPVRPQRELRVSVPIKERSCPGPWSAPVVLQSGTRAMTATASCTGLDAKQLDVVGGRPPAYGSYTGSIKLGGSDVQLTVTTAAGWLWPIVAAVVGLFFGLWQRGYLTNRRPISRLVTKAKALCNTARDADKAVISAMATMKYVIGPGAEREATALSERVTAVLGRYRGPWRWFSHPGEDDAVVVDQITKDIAADAAVITDWRARSVRVLTTLESTVDARATSAGTLAPKLIAHARAVLDPGATVALELRSVAGFLADAEATAALLDLLPAVDQLNTALNAREADVPKYQAWQKAWYAESRGLLNEVMDALQTADSGTGPVADDLDHALEQARRIAIRLPVMTRRAVGGGIRTETVGSVVMLAPVPAAVSGGLFDLIRARLASPADRLVRRTRTTDYWLLVLASVVAVWGGLVAWYFGKPWGTAIDVITALLWGIAAALVAGPLVEAVERVTQNAADRRAQRTAPGGTP